MVQGAGERGGAERILLALARHLPDHGIEPVVGFLAQGPFADEVAGHGIETVNLGQLPRARDLRRAGSVVESIAQGIASTRATAVLANGEKMAPYVGWAARRCDVTSIIWLHDAPLRDLASSVLQTAMVASPHDLVVAGSEWMAERFRSLLGMDVRCIRHGLDLDSFPEPGDIRAEAGWPAGPLVITLAGRLQRWKGADVLLRAASRLIRSGRDARFAFLGGALYGWEEDYAADLPRLATDLGVADRCWFAGHRDDALALLATTDIAVHASRRPEPLGLVVPEAMALSRPVVATRTRGPEEVIDPGRTGLLVPPDDDRALAAALGCLIDDPDGARAMGEAAAAEIAAHWSAPAMAEGFARLMGAAA
jgi:glycosyltransferase involved in cell wall biosynthesis